MGDYLLVTYGYPLTYVIIHICLHEELVVFVHVSAPLYVSRYRLKYIKASIFSLEDQVFIELIKHHIWDRDFEDSRIFRGYILGLGSGEQTINEPYA
jgi:hypothetical protein